MTGLITFALSSPPQAEGILCCFYEQKKLWRSIGVDGKGLRLFLSTKIKNLIDPKGLVVIARLDILRMKAPAIEHDEPVGPHVDTFQQFPIFISVVDKGITSTGEKGIENHAILEIFISLLAGKKIVAQFQLIGQLSDRGVRHNRYAFEPCGPMAI